MHIEYYATYISPLQKRIMLLVGQRARVCKEPVKQKYILKIICWNKIPVPTVKAALQSLVRRGYIRRAVKVKGGVAYVQIRFL